jgi:hypothetical protein
MAGTACKDPLRFGTPHHEFTASRVRTLLQAEPDLLQLVKQMVVNQVPVGESRTLGRVWHGNRATIMKHLLKNQYLLEADLVPASTDDAGQFD